MSRKLLAHSLAIAALISLAVASSAVAQTQPQPQTTCPQFSYPQLPANFRPRLVQELTGHTSFVYALTFSCDRQLFRSPTS